MYNYSADYFALGKQLTGMAEKILAGRKPSEIPIEYPKRHTLQFDVRFAKEIGVTIPQELLSIADVIKE